MKAYVIKRDDGKYSKKPIRKDKLFVDKLDYWCLYGTKDDAVSEMCMFDLENCKVVPVKIKECEDE